MEKPESSGAKEKADTHVSSLSEYGATVFPDRSVEGAYAAEFKYEGGVTSTLRISLNDKQTNADLIITNTTTLPYEAEGKGYASKAVASLLEWAASEGLADIRAVQVGSYAEAFWIKNGFVKQEGPNPTNDFLYRS